MSFSRTAAAEPGTADAAGRNGAANGQQAAPPRVAEVRGGGKTLPFLVRTLRRTLALAADRSSPRGAELARTYLRLKLRQRLLRPFPSLERKRERLLDYTVDAFDYWILVYLFEEVFISRDYSFETDSERPRIVDCGSHIGLAILYFKYLHPTARILGFEADPDTFAMLQTNVRQNRLSDVEVRNEALFPGRDTVELYRDPSWQGVPFTSTDRRFVEQYGSATRELPPPHVVKATVLSQYLTEPVDFLKMDIEGAELPVLEEVAASGRLEVIRQMIIEYHHHIDARTDRLAVLLGLLERHGFGYQLRAPLESPFRRRTYQNVLVYAYRQ